MEKLKQTSDEFFKSITIIYYAMMIGMVVFGCLVVFVINLENYNTEGESLTNIFMYIVPVFVAAGLISSHFVFKSRLKSIDKESGFSFKIMDYRAALIVRYALLEGVALFAIVTYLVTGNIVFIILAAFVIFVFITIRPTREKAVVDLKLTAEEEQVILRSKE